MTGPNAETAQLHTQVSYAASVWPMELWADEKSAAVECGVCGSGPLAYAKDRVGGSQFTVAMVIAALEQHIPNCGQG